MFCAPAWNLHIPDEADEEGKCADANIKWGHPRLFDSVFDSCYSLFSMQPSVKDDRVLFLKNISQNKAAELAVLWKQNSNVANFFPLLNKVKIHMVTSNRMMVERKSCFSCEADLCLYLLFLFSGIFWILDQCWHRPIHSLVQSPKKRHWLWNLQT